VLGEAVADPEAACRTGVSAFANIRRQYDPAQRTCVVTIDEVTAVVEAGEADLRAATTVILRGQRVPRDHAVVSLLLSPPGADERWQACPDAKVTGEPAHPRVEVRMSPALLADWLGDEERMLCRVPVLLAPDVAEALAAYSADVSQLLLGRKTP
jgi:hypothetical protein